MHLGLDRFQVRSGTISFRLGGKSPTRWWFSKPLAATNAPCYNGCGKATSPAAWSTRAASKAFAQSEGLKAKTDPIDARLIRRFACEKCLPPQAPKEERHLALAELMDRRGHLSEQITREKNRLKKCTHLTTRLIKKMIRAVEKQIAEVDCAIEALIAEESTLSTQAAQLQSVKGVDPVTAANLLAYLPEMGKLSRNQLVALAPYNRDSGKKQGRRFIRAGRAKVRRCLYMAAQSAAVHNPHIKAYVKRLRANGKPYKVAITAAMRKLLIHLQTIIKNAEYALA